MKISRNRFYFLSIILITTTILSFYISGFYYTNSWIFSNNIWANHGIYMDGTTAILVDPNDDVWFFNNTDATWTNLMSWEGTSSSQAINIKYIYARDLGGYSYYDFVIEFNFDTILPWDDSRYGFIFYIIPDLNYITPREEVEDPIYYNFTLLCQDGEVFFFDNSTPTEYWDGTNWITTQYSLTPVVHYDRELAIHDLARAVEDKYSANFTGSNPSYPRFKYDFLFKGVTFFEENESITYYDWIPGNDFVYLTNSYPLMNLILIILIIAIPITFLIDRYVIKPSLEPQKAKRDFSRKKMRRRKARRLSSI